jgi:hypothetical protein
MARAIDDFRDSRMGAGKEKPRWGEAGFLKPATKAGGRVVPAPLMSMSASIISGTNIRSSAIAGLGAET